MKNYYPVLVAITIISVAIIVYHLLNENDNFSRRIKKTLGKIGFLIIICTLMEAIGRMLDGMEAFIILHRLVKATEFSLAPIIPLEFSRVIEPNLKNKRKGKVLIVILALNSFFELASLLVPLVFYIDENFIYTRGTYYIIYVATYSLAILYLFHEIERYNHKYQSTNNSIVAMILFLLAGLSMRIVCYDIYTDWIIIAICYLMFIVCFSDTYNKTDALTGMLTRKAFKNKLKQVDYDTAIVVIDANNFKKINDDYGHPKGDCVLKIIATYIRQVYDRCGYCYRIGGDEFAIILKEGKLEQLAEETGMLEEEAIQQLNNQLDELIKKKSEDKAWLKYGLSEGAEVYYYEKNDDENSILHVFEHADNAMYKDKERKKLKRR